MTEKFLNKNKDYFYFVFRILVGFMFFQHGAQKLFGMFGGNTVEIFSLFGLAGVIEFFGGIFIAVGLFTRFSALISALDMVGAWFIGHIGGGWIPIVNQGELALLYFASFLIIIVYGSGKWGIDNSLFKRR